VTGFLLDTNVISELMRLRSNRSVVEWINATPEELLHLSVLTLGEIRKGIELLAADDPRRGPLQSWLERDVAIRFSGRILPFGDAVALRWGHVEASARKAGLTLSTIDAELAATALHYNLTFVTRNTSHFSPAGVAVFNPWH
jgi:predicted nucleic acid-binding protein